MAKNTKIICTVLPNGFNAAKTQAKFSLFLSPRLPDSGIIKDYYEIFHWDEFVDLFRKNAGLQVTIGDCNDDAGDNTFSLKETQSIPVAYDGTSIDELGKNDDRLKTPQFLWNCLFKFDTPVKGWYLDEGEYAPKKVFLYKNEIVGNEATEIPNPEVQPVHDISSNNLNEDEIAFNNKLNQEFHRKMSALSQYPHLLRAMCWIIDFVIPLSGADLTAFKKGNVIKFKFNDSLPSDKEMWKEFADEIDFKCPWTYYDRDVEKGFFDYKYNDALVPKYYAIEKRYIKKQNDCYKLEAVQYNRNSSLNAIAGRLKRDGGVSASEYSALHGLLGGDPSDTLRDVSTVSEGIVLSVVPEKACLLPAQVPVTSPPGTYQVTLDQFTINSKPAELVSIDDYLILGHNLDAGYIIEVSDVADGKFMSLTKRIADYKVDISESFGKHKYDNLLEAYKDEGSISEVAVAGKSGKIYIKEEICRWNNWSLICPQLGTHPQPEKLHRDQGFREYNDLELTNIRPERSSLPKLRFGHSYKFRVRVTDLCGNARGVLPAGSSAFEVESQPYKRLEPLNKVALFFCENAFDKIGSGKEQHFVTTKRYLGEKEDIMAIRSDGGHWIESPLQKLLYKIKDNPRRRSYTYEISERSVSPPKVVMQFCELHGECDSILSDKRLYSKAAHEPDPSVPEIYKVSKHVPYLTDPVVKYIRVTLRVLSKMDMPDVFWKPFTGEVAEQLPAASHYPDWMPEDYSYGVDIYSVTQRLPYEDNYLETRFKGIVLESIDNKLNSLELIDDKVHVYLKPGTIGHVYLSVWRDDVMKEYLDRDIFQKPRLDPDFSFHVFRKVTVVHAVKKPNVYNPQQIIKLKLKDRKPLSKLPLEAPHDIFKQIDANVDNVFELPDGEINFPFSTSASIHLKMKYDEVVLDPDSIDGYWCNTVTKVKEISNLCDTVRVTRATRNDFRNDDVLTPLKYPRERIKGFLECEKLGDDRFLRHSFGDTRHKIVRYWLEGVSRFQQFYEVTKPDDFLYSEPVLSSTSAEELHVKNSCKPKAPVIHSIVPLFTWDLHLRNQIVRENTQFRIYFDGGWYDSGEGEQVSVIFFPDQPTIPDVLVDTVSSFGKDPARPGSVSSGLKEEYFAGHPIEKVNEELLNFEVRKADELADRKPKDDRMLSAAIYDVKYDRDKKMFFADISIKLGKDIDTYYMPFLKLALTRYQHHSISQPYRYDYRFSKVAVAPHVQVMPRRSVVWNRIKGTVTIDGAKGEGNLFYLRCVKHFANNITTLDNPITKFDHLTDQNIVYLPLVASGNTYSLPADAPNLSSLGERSIYLEEYETYKSAPTDQFVVATKAIINAANLYDPSNDIGKRLVFSCSITESETVAGREVSPVSK